MKAKITVTFDMVFDSSKSGKCTSEVRFALPDHPETPCPENVKRLVIGEIKMLCGALCATPESFMP